MHTLATPPSNVAASLPTKLLDNLSTAVILLDANLHIVYINTAAEMLLESSGARNIGERFDHLLQDADRTLIALDSILESQTPLTKREAHITLANGATLTVDYTITPVEDISNTAIIIEIQPLDRLLRISREETIFSTQESTDALIKGIAHEVKNPLGGLRGAAQLLERELDDPSLMEYTGIIISEADRLRNLVDRMLGPNDPPKKEIMNVHEVLERVRQLIDVESNGSVRFIRDYDPSIPDIYADRERLIQAVLNIVRNAMQALHASHTASPHILLATRIMRQFTIGGHCHKLVCRIDIEDNGPGIPDTLQDKIFLPMVTGHAENTGLGLSIAQSIVKQANGLIAFDTEPGRTRFSLFIPLESN